MSKMFIQISETIMQKNLIKCVTVSVNPKVKFSFHLLEGAVVEISLPEDKTANQFMEEILEKLNN